MSDKFSLNAESLHPYGVFSMSFLSYGKEESPAISVTRLSKRKRPVSREKAAAARHRPPHVKQGTKGTRAFPLAGICEWVKLAVLCGVRLG